MSGNGVISVELSNLKATSTRMQQVTESLNNIHQAMNNIMGDMDPIWEGKARDKFRENSQKLQQKVKNLGDEITKRKQMLDESVAVYEKTENTVMTQVNDLSTDGIF